METIRQKREHWSEWFAGARKEWEAMPMAERDALSFKATGCECAYPTWRKPVDCVHIRCQIRRGEKPPIALTHAIIRSEAERGWLRFSDRTDLAAAFRRLRNVAKATGIYDPWKNGSWGVMVSAAVCN